MFLFVRCFSVTFRQLMILITKQLRKDHSFNRCESMIKDVIEEFSVCFQGTLPLMECSSPARVKFFFHKIERTKTNLLFCFSRRRVEEL